MDPTTGIDQSGVLPPLADFSIPSVPALITPTAAELAAAAAKRVPVLLTPEQAALENARLSKGYAYAPVIEKQDSLVVEGKRERRQPKPLEVEIVAAAAPKARTPKTPAPVRIPTVTPIAAPQESDKKRRAPSTAVADPQDDAELKKLMLQIKLKELELQLETVKGSNAAAVAATPTFAAPPPKRTKVAHHTPSPAPIVMPARDDDEYVPSASPAPPRSTGRPPRRSLTAATSYQEDDDNDLEQKFAPAEETEASKLSKCAKLLETIFKSVKAELFRAPVDWKTLNLLDYPKIVINPMDLGTVRSMLSAGQITTVDDFCRNVRQVWHNAFRYNPFTNHVFKMARDLAEKFETEMVKIRYPAGAPSSKRKNTVSASGGARRGRRPAGYVDPMPSPAPALVTPTAAGGAHKARKSFGTAEMVAPTPVSAESLSRRVSALHPTPVATPTAPALSPEEEDPLPTGVYSYAKRQQLGNLIPGLPTEKLNDLLAVIQQYSNAPQGDSEEVVLDLEKLDDRTMHALDRFVHDTLDPSARTRRLQANAAQRAQAAGMAQRAAQLKAASVSLDAAITSPAQHKASSPVAAPPVVSEPTPVPVVAEQRKAPINPYAAASFYAAPRAGAQDSEEESDADDYPQPAAE